MTARGNGESGELMPCPFCGDRPDWPVGDDVDHRLVGEELSCNGCGCSMFGETKAAAVAAWNVRVVKFDVAIEKSQETRMVVSSKAIDGGAAVEKAERVLDSYVRAVDASDDAGIEGCLAQMMGDPVCLTGVLSIHYAIWKKWMRDRKPDA